MAWFISVCDQIIHPVPEMELSLQEANPSDKQFYQYNISSGHSTGKFLAKYLKDHYLLLDCFTPF